MRDDWDQFTRFAAPDFLPVFDEAHADGAGFTEVVAALFRQEMAVALAEADAEFDRLFVYGNGAGEPRGFLARTASAEPTPAERALAILDPELRRCPLYDAGPPALYPHTWKA